MKAVLRTLVLSFAFCSAAAFAGPVNVNTADAATLAAELKGVGEKTAMAIVAYREEHGPFKAIEDLKNVKGVGDKVIENNLENILFTDAASK